MREAATVKALLGGNRYPGRGIVAGASADGRAMFAYFIMGRSENSRNRVFAEYGDEIRTEPFDESKVTAPSLILYSPVKCVGRDIIVSNGDQTDTIERSLRAGHCFRHALMQRTFEPDAPNFTPRISAILHLGTGAEAYSYELSMLKCADGEGRRACRFFFAYEAEAGVGHLIHTYRGDGSPLPSFEGEPVRVKLPTGAKEFAEELWESLDKENRISLAVRAVDMKTGETERVLFNRFVR